MGLQALPVDLHQSIEFGQCEILTNPVLEENGRFVVEETLHERVPEHESVAVYDRLVTERMLRKRGRVVEVSRRGRNQKSPWMVTDDWLASKSRGDVMNKIHAHPRQPEQALPEMCLDMACDWCNDDALTNYEKPCAEKTHLIKTV